MDWRPARHFDSSSFGVVALAAVFFVVSAAAVLGSIFQADPGRRDELRRVVSFAASVPSGARPYGEISRVTILSVNGLCVLDEPPRLADGTACGAAAYGPTGFSGSIEFDQMQASTMAHVVAYVCGSRPGSAGFDPVPATYRFTVSGAELPSVSRTFAIDDAANCANRSGNFPARPFNVVDTLTFKVPADAKVQYTLSLDGTTPADAHVRFEAYARILVHAADIEDPEENEPNSEEESPAVAPPSPPPVIPEASLPALLLVTSVLAAVWLGLRGARGGAARDSG